jgi:hypothetical protein
LSPSPLSDAGERRVQRGRPPPKRTHERDSLHAGGGGGRHTRRKILVGCRVLREGSPLLVANPALARLPLIPPSCVTPILWRCASAASEYGRREASSASPSTRVQAPAASSGAICIPTMSAEVRARSNRAPRGLTQHARTVLSGGSANGRWWPSGRAQSRLTPTPKLCCPPATCSVSYRTLSASRQHSGLRVQWTGLPSFSS